MEKVMQRKPCPGAQEVIIDHLTSKGPQTAQAVGLALYGTVVPWDLEATKRKRRIWAQHQLQHMHGDQVRLTGTLWSRGN
jgi:hypothetical protein